MIWIDFDDIWQKYSEDSRIEFAYFSFHAYRKLRVHAVHFSQLLSAPFLVALETQIFVNNLWKWRSTDPPASLEISLTVRWLWGLSSRLSNSDSTVPTFLSVCAVQRLPMPGRLLLTVPNFTSSLLVLFFVQPLVRNSVKNCYNLYILADFWLKFCLLYWAASKLPRLLDTVSKFTLFSVSDLTDEKLIKQQAYMKTETCKFYSRDIWIFLPNSIKIDPYHLELYRFKLGPFFWDTVYIQTHACTCMRAHIYIYTWGAIL